MIRKAILLASMLLIGQFSFAQSPTLQQKLYYTCKVWGFVKYYHSNVSTCHVNWDSVLLHVLPLVRTATTSSDFNDALDTMLAAAGPMTVATSYFPDTLAPELKRNRDWSWITSPLLRSDVQIQLDTIKNNFRPHAGCYVNYATSASAAYNWGGFLEFPPDTIMLPVTMHTAYPDADHRQLALCKLWNMIRYFNPYNYVLTTPCDTTLFNSVLPFDNAATENDFNLAYLRLTGALDDAHVFGLSFMYYPPIPPGDYQPLIRLKYVEGQYVVIGSMEPGVNLGDAILSIDGLTVSQWEDSLKPYFSEGSIEIKRRDMAEYILRRVSIGTNETIVLADSTGSPVTVTVTTKNSYSSTYSSFFYDYYYPADSLKSIDWTIFDCNVGYMNFGNITDGGTDSAYDAMRSLPAIVIDIRNYPVSGNAWALSNKTYTGPTEFAKLTIPDVTYPGTYYWDHEVMGVAGNPTPYLGKIVVIVDEVTQSAAEYTTMMLKKNPGAVVVGSHTAGADGNVTYMKVANDMRFGWTSLGVYYPNGDSTQRIGIVPDSFAYPTKEGVRHHRDYVLEKALQIAGCNLATRTVNNSPAIVSIHPNPATDEVTIDASGIRLGNDIDMSITDMTGKVLLQKQIKVTGPDISTSVDIHTLASGMYLVRLKTGTDQYISKLVK